MPSAAVKAQNGGILKVALALSAFGRLIFVRTIAAGVAYNERFPASSGATEEPEKPIALGACRQLRLDRGNTPSRPLAYRAPSASSTLRVESLRVLLLRRRDAEGEE